MHRQSRIDTSSILRWAAGARIHLPPLSGLEDERVLAFLGVDDDALLQLIDRHRLANRFVARAASERPAWCPQHLLRAVAGLAEQANVRARQQRSALHEVHTTAARDNEAVIVIKGCSTFALTGSTEAIRLSADIDLFGPDPQRLTSLLRRIGFTGDRKWGGHEWSTMRRDDVNIEVHRSFPVCSYPYDLPLCMTPGEHPEMWLQGFSQPNSAELAAPIYDAKVDLHYQDLAPYAVGSRVPATLGLLVPRPEMSVLILCAHVFRDFISPPFHVPLPVQISVLADITDLTALRGFDASLLQRLAERFRAGDSLTFVWHVIHALLNRDVRALRVAARRASRLVPAGRFSWTRRESACPERFARALSYHGCWAALTSFEELLFPLPFEALVERLGPNHVQARPGATRSEPCSGRTDGNRLSRMIVQSRAAGQPSVYLEVSRDNSSLVVDVILENLRGEAEAAYLRFDAVGYDTLTHWMKIDNSGEVVTQKPLFGNGEARLVTTPTDRIYRLIWPLGAIPSTLRSRTRMPAMLRLMQSHRVHDEKAILFDPVVVAPLHVAF